MTGVVKLTNRLIPFLSCQLLIPTLRTILPARRLLFTMKIDTPEFKNILTEEVKILEKLFTENGHELRIAGGAVRDLLLGIQPKDLDFATTATPDQMKEMFEKNEIRMINMSGEKHGTITPRINDKENFEVTTLRIDVVTDGRRAEVQFVKDWKLDANRRDLTINSMFLGLDGTVYDYFNGYEDLKNRRVLFVGDAATRIHEDYLRILRYFRFYGRIAEDFDRHDLDTLKALEENCSGLNRVSGERIWSELSKTIEGNFGAELLRLMVQLKIGPYIGLPEKCDMEEYERASNCIKSSGLSVRAITLISGLLNSEADFLLFHKRCKLSNTDRDLGLFIVRHRNDEIPVVKPLRPFQVLVLSSQNTEKEVRLFVEQLFIYRGLTDLLKDFESWETPKFPINGNMIRAAVETKSGRHLGFLLKSLKEIWIESNFTATAEELLGHLPTLVNEPSEKKIKTE